MIDGGPFLEVCIHIALGVMSLAFLFTVYRIVTGPTFPDRFVALDMLVTVGIGFIAVIGVKTDFYLYLDIAIALGLVGFLATVAFARFLLNRGLAGDAAITAETHREPQSTQLVHGSVATADSAKEGRS
ncbi:cation:proton antiporter [Breoghania sp.]|uniref:cation:proton antiporter n=1 Tax=Breoghania sp. TaxID=2065378 RepID=UPI00260A9B04|nr:cation:proton antiporter [Breoghania sp.]MDJ0931792.1 cation:proton antiporter [Breoghania sp.]